MQKCNSDARTLMCRCSWESLVLGHNRFCELGATTIRNVAIERLKVAAEQLPNKSEPVRSLVPPSCHSKWALSCVVHQSSHSIVI